MQDHCAQRDSGSLEGQSPADTVGWGQLSTSELAAAEAALLGEQGAALRRAIFQLSIGQQATRGVGLDLARCLGWVEGDVLTELGEAVVGPIREFVFWEQRNGKLPSADLVPTLRRDEYNGKTVVELGCGGGCNLLSLTGVPGRQVGVDAMPATLQLQPILARLAGLPAPEAVVANAEHTPFADDEFDIALCYSSHQYMDLHRAFDEIDRIVNDHGQIYIMGAIFGPFVREAIGRLLRGRDLGILKYDTYAVVNTLTYQLLGRRVLGVRLQSSTATPIYPSSRWMRRQLKKRGFVVDDVRTTRLPGSEVALIARRV